MAGYGQAACLLVLPSVELQGVAQKSVDIFAAVFTDAVKANRQRYKECFLSTFRGEAVDIRLWLLFMGLVDSHCILFGVCTREQELRVCGCFDCVWL
jgi:hypothetical protein